MWQFLLSSSTVCLYIRVYVICARKCLYQQLPKGISSSQELYEILPLVHCFHKEYEGPPRIIENMIAKHLDGLYDLYWKLYCLLFLFIWEDHTVYNFFFANPPPFLPFQFLSYLLTFTQEKSMCSYFKSTECTYYCQYHYWQLAKHEWESCLRHILKKTDIPCPSNQ